MDPCDGAAAGSRQGSAVDCPRVERQEVLYWLFAPVRSRKILADRYYKQAKRLVDLGLELFERTECHPLDAVAGAAEGGRMMAFYCNGKKGMCDVSMLCKDCGYFDNSGGKRTVTNGDRIRAMDDEGLRKFICDIATCESCRFSASWGCALGEWLQQPAEGV